MILLCKGTCAPVAPLFKGQGGSAPVMHPVPASLARGEKNYTAPSKIYLLWCRLWFCNFLRPSTEIKSLSYILLKNIWQCDLFLEFI